MNYEEMRNPGYIAHADTIQSIVGNGILSHNRAERHPHQSIALEEVQSIRSQKSVPGGLPIHDYANLYFDVRNPMMIKRRDIRSSLVVVEVDKAIVDQIGVVVTDQNAASKYVRFASPRAGLQIVSAQSTYARDWTDDDQIQYWRKKSRKCAEILVPHVVEPSHFVRIHCYNDQARQVLDAMHLSLDVQITPDLFFGEGA